jgi:hypothetical protein
MNLHPSERAHIIAVFGPYLTNWGELDLYWVPSQKRAAMRRVVTERAKRRLPEGSIHVGRYRHPCSCEDYIGDLEDVIASLNSPAPAGRVEAHEARAG